MSILLLVYYLLFASLFYEVMELSVRLLYTTRAIWLNTIIDITEMIESCKRVLLLTATGLVFLSVTIGV